MVATYPHAEAIIAPEVVKILIANCMSGYDEESIRRRPAPGNPRNAT